MRFCRPYKISDKIGSIFISYPFGAIDPVHPQGHLGTDFVAPYGTFLVAPEDVMIENVVDAKIISKSYDELRRGYGVVMKSQTTSGVFHLYWHCLPIFPVKVGQIVKQGQPVAQMGNSGIVASGEGYIPLEERVRTKAGTHLHWEAYKLNQGKRDYFDVMPYVDMTIPIKYDLITTIKSIIQGIANLLK